MAKNSGHTKLLGDVADIKTGFTFRGKIEELPKDEGNAHIVQIKDVRKAWEESGTAQLEAAQLPVIEWDGKPTAFVEPGSVLMPARGGYFRASFLVEGGKEYRPIVVSSQLLVITPREGVLPEFLCWSLNQPAMQKTLLDSAQGTSIPMLKAAVLKKLTLVVPSLEVQHQVLRVNRLWEQEQQLTQALLKNRETMLQGMYQQLLMEKQ